MSFDNINVGDIVQVDWIDHWGCNISGWADSSKIRAKPYSFKSAGFVLFQDETVIVLSISVSLEKNINNALDCMATAGIIKSAITKINKIAGAP